jgi:hypothetical protein
MRVHLLAIHSYSNLIVTLPCSYELMHMPDVHSCRGQQSWGLSMLTTLQLRPYRGEEVTSLHHRYFIPSAGCTAARRSNKDGRLSAAYEFIWRRDDVALMQLPSPAAGSSESVVRLAFGSAGEGPGG